MNISNNRTLRPKRSVLRITFTIKPQKILSIFKKKYLLISRKQSRNPIGNRHRKQKLPPYPQSIELYASNIKI